MDLARLGVDEVRLDLVAVATEQRVGKRAVAPVDARAVEVDQERRHRIEQAVAVRPRDRAGSAIRRRRYWIEKVRYSVARIASSRPGQDDRPIAVTAGRPAASSRRRTSNSAVATWTGSSLSAIVRSSATRNRTRWRDGPTGSWRKVRVSGHSASGSSQGRSSRVALAPRRRRLGKREPLSVVRASFAGTRSPSSRSRATRTGAAPLVGGGPRSAR